MTGLESKIKLFLDHFKEKLDRLESYSFEQEDRLFKKNIIVSILDALARTTFRREGALLDSPRPRDRIFFGLRRFSGPPWVVQLHFIDEVNADHRTRGSGVFGPPGRGPP